MEGAEARRVWLPQEVLNVQLLALRRLRRGRGLRGVVGFPRDVDPIFVAGMVPSFLCEPVLEIGMSASVSFSVLADPWAEEDVSSV